MNNENRNEEIARYFSHNNIKAHIIRNDNIFFNGLIKEVSSDFFIIDDNKDGHMVIFFRELKNPIEEFQEVGK